MNIYVGNLAYSVTEDELQTLFAAHGSVSSVSLIKDKYTNQSKGFGFVEMDKQAEAEEAIKGNDKAAIDAKSEALAQASQKLGEHMYAQAQAEAGQPQGEGSSQGSKKADDADVVDAEFTEVKDQK